MCNPNLLINTDFTNPVNQRGQTEYTNAGYCIDMWSITNRGLTIKITDDGIQLIALAADKNLRQTIENYNILYGKTLTFTLLTSKGVKCTTFTLPATPPSIATNYGATVIDNLILYLRFYTDGHMIVELYSRAALDITIKAVKLELGTVSTLANEVVDYAAELCKCQRYYVKSVMNITYTVLGLGIPTTISTNVAARVIVNMPNVMRQNPTGIANNLYLFFNDATAIKVTGVLWTDMDMPGTCRIALETEAKMPIAQSFILTNYTSANGFLELSAEL